MYDCMYCDATFTGPPLRLTVADYPVAAGRLANGVAEPEEEGGGFTLCPGCAASVACVACGSLISTGATLTDEVTANRVCRPCYAKAPASYNGYRADL